MGDSWGTHGGLFGDSWAARYVVWVFGGEGGAVSVLYLGGLVGDSWGTRWGLWGDSWAARGTRREKASAWCGLWGDSSETTSALYIIKREYEEEKWE